jgi:hypothetical protein
MKWTVPAVLALLAALTLLPGTAVAKPGFRKVAPFHAVELEPVSGSNGYEIYGSVENGTASMTATSQTDAEGSSVIYERPQRIGPGNRLDIDLGKAGSLKARFIAEKVQKTKPSQGCVGGPIVQESGSFVGLFSFHGANGFTKLRAHRIEATVFSAPGMVCPRQPGDEEKVEPIKLEGVLRVTAGVPSGSTYFDAVTEPGDDVVPATSTYSASTDRKEGPLDIRETVRAEAPSPLPIPDLTGTLPATVSLAPPAPFSGSATLEAPSRATGTWSGDLTVDFPATGEVPLTGPGIAAGLCHDYTCSESLPSALRPQWPPANQYRLRSFASPS